VATRDAPVGGQAVLEGVMMRGIDRWAVAVRKPADGSLGEIAVSSFPLDSWVRRHRVYRWPIIRGVVALVESLAIGMRALGISANAQLPADEAGDAGGAPRPPDDAGAAHSGEAGCRARGTPAGVAGGEQISGRTWFGAVAVAVVFAIALFFVVPVGLTSLIKHQLNSSVLFWAVEGVIRTAIFLGYLFLLSRIPDLRRVFQYHGAEHKVISCYEAEDELVPERATLYSRLHPRCGTSFLLVVMIVAIFVFAPIGLPAWWILVITRIVGVPLIAGLSLELIKWAGRNRRRGWVKAIMYPGLQLQKLTTREPDLDQLAVAIAAMDNVLAAEGQQTATARDLVGLEVVA